MLASSLALHLRVPPLLKQKTTWATAVLLAACGWLLFLHEAHFGHFFTDDGFISLRYTERLLQGKGLTWDDYERVEGYSNLLWVLLCAVPGLLGVDLVVGAQVLGFICVMGCMAAFFVLARPENLRALIAPFAASLLLVATNSIAVWSTGGLEPPLLMLLLAWGLVFYQHAIDGSNRAAWGAAICFGLACWTRPDAPLFALGAGLSALVAGRRGVQPFLLIGAVAAAFVAAQLTFRWLYYDDLLPNTAYAKVVIADQRLEAGYEYITKSIFPLGATWFLLLSATLFFPFATKERARYAPYAVLTALWVAYLIRVGGDNFPAWRQLPYLVVLSALALTQLGAQQLRRSVGIVPALFILAFPAFAWAAGHHDPDNHAEHERWQWDGRPVGRALSGLFAEEQPLIAVDAAGAIPLFSKLPALDMLGLNDRYLAHHRPAEMGKLLIGHELGDADYYLSREVDIFCFGVPPCHRGARFRAQRDMARRREFRQSYSLVRMRVEADERPLVSELWVRNEGKVGIYRSDELIRIPGWFFASTDHAMSRVRDGRLQTVVFGKKTATYQVHDLAPGDYALRFTGLTGKGRAKASVIAQRGRQETKGSSAAPPMARVGKNGRLRLSLVTKRHALIFETLELRRTHAAP